MRTKANNKVEDSLCLQMRATICMSLDHTTLITLAIRTVATVLGISGNVNILSLKERLLNQMFSKLSSRKLQKGVLSLCVGSESSQVQGLD